MEPSVALPLFADTKEVFGDSGLPTPRQPPNLTAIHMIMMRHKVAGAWTAH